MDGTIHIKGCPIDCSIGVYPHEKEITQTLLLDLDLTFDFSSCIESDDIKDTVDYDQVASLATALGQQEHTHLLEVFTYKLLHRIFAEFPLVNWAKVEVTKPRGLPQVQSISCIMELTR